MSGASLAYATRQLELAGELGDSTGVHEGAQQTLGQKDGRGLGGLVWLLYVLVGVCWLGLVDMCCSCLVLTGVLCFTF